MEAVFDPSRDLAQPRSRDGLGVGAMLALLVHVLLVVALAFGVSWRTHEPDGVVAELWSAVPQIAGPRATTPPPAPAPPRVAPEPPRPSPPATETTRVADAQIAIEKARREAEARDSERQQLEAKREAAREQAEREQAEKIRQKAAADQAKREQAAKDEAQRKKDAAEKERREEVALATQRDAFLKRMQGQAAAGETGATGAQTSGPSASYAGRIRARVKPNIVFTDDIAGNPTAMVEVRCAPDGTIVSRKLVKSSGVGAWDEAVLRALDKTEVLPRDTDGRVPTPMQLEFRPRD